LFAWIIGLAYSLTQREPVQTVYSIFLGAAVCLILYPLFKIGALGAGDIKLYGASTIYFSFDLFLKFFLLSMVLAALVSLIKLIRDQNGVERLKYFVAYLAEVFRRGEFQLYFENEAQRNSASICLAGPMLLSLLLCLGGVIN